MDAASVTGSNPLGAGRFLSLKTIDWMDARGIARKWESAERVNDSGAVLIIPHLEPSDRILVIKQFRPPVGGMTVEFPAGLIDDGEEADAAALRELREETGYHAARIVVNPPAYTSPGLTNESVHVVKAFIDETTPENLNPQPEFDGSEMIESILLPRIELPAFYRRETAAGTAFDAKLAAYILCME